MLSKFIGLLFAVVTFVSLVVYASYSNRLEEDIITLRLKATDAKEKVVLEGVELAEEFELRNNSEQPIEVTGLTTSCPCFSVQSPTSLPFTVCPQDRVTINTLVKAEPTFEPVALELYATASIEGQNKTLLGQVTVKCLPFVRVYPAVLSFGNVGSEIKKGTINLFQSELAEANCEISSIKPSSPAITVVESESDSSVKVPKGYKYIRTLEIEMNPETLKGAFKEKIHVSFSNGKQVFVYVAGIAN